jgi:hypothetical protein
MPPRLVVQRVAEAEVLTCRVTSRRTGGRILVAEQQAMQRYHDRGYEWSTSMLAMCRFELRWSRLKSRRVTEVGARTDAESHVQITAKGQPWQTIATYMTDVPLVCAFCASLRRSKLSPLVQCPGTHSCIIVYDMLL